jgi:hypothetical protein
VYVLWLKNSIARSIAGQPWNRHLVHNSSQFYPAGEPNWLEQIGAVNH